MMPYTPARLYAAFVTSPSLRRSVTRLLAAAAQAPSPHGRQPWRFVVIGAGTPLRASVRCHERRMARSSLAADGSDAAVIATRIAASCVAYHHCAPPSLPCVDLSVLDHVPRCPRQHAEYLMAVQSIGCAIQNMLLTAVAHGVDGGWMCAPLFCSDTVRHALRTRCSMDSTSVDPVWVYWRNHRYAVPKRTAADLRWILVINGYPIRAIIAFRSKNVRAVHGYFPVP
jgi:hypothetical protein